MPTVGAMFRLTLAVPPSAPAGVKPARLMPATGVDVIAAPLTMLSASVAVSVAPPLPPTARLSALGQLATSGSVTGVPQTRGVEAVLRGSGAPTTKSALLLLVSVQPKSLRSTAVVFDGPAVGAVSEPLAVEPKPTRSCSAALLGTAPLSAAIVLLR